jgi:hypothetical protein
MTSVLLLLLLLLLLLAHATEASLQPLMTLHMTPWLTSTTSTRPRLSHTATRCPGWCGWMRRGEIICAVRGCSARCVLQRGGDHGGVVTLVVACDPDADAAGVDEGSELLQRGQRTQVWEEQQHARVSAAGIISTHHHHHHHHNAAHHALAAAAPL